MHVGHAKILYETMLMNTNAPVTKIAIQVRFFQALAEIMGVRTPPAILKPLPNHYTVLGREGRKRDRGRMSEIGNLANTRLIMKEVNFNNNDHYIQY